MTFSMKRVNILYLLVGVVAMIAASLLYTVAASAHGYVESPKSRSLLCNEGANQNCGGIQYEPQSVEGPGDFPEAGVPDGKIAGGGGFEPLNEEGPNRWAKNSISSGQNTFTWHLTAAHYTQDWKYYITKNDWEPTGPLKRSDLEEFCYIYDGTRPEQKTSHTCDVPEREGYHVILAYWEVGDTANAFYQAIDVNFDGGHNPVDPVDPVDPEEPGDGDNGDGNNEAPAWSSNTVYLGGEQVSHNGNVYEALWWTQGQEPGTNDVWVLISEGDGGDNGDGDNGDGDNGDGDNGNGDNGDGDNGDGDNGDGDNGDGDNGDGDNGDGDNGDGDNGDTPSVPAWDASAVYLGGDQVSHNGNVYEAAWWTQGETPGDSNVWNLVSGDNGNGDGGNGEDPVGNEYDANVAYVGGDVVVYDGQTYKAKWWTLGENPAEADVWELQ